MYIVKVIEGTRPAKYLHRGSLVDKQEATWFQHPSAAQAALKSFLKQRQGRLAVEVVDMRAVEGKR